MPAESSLFAEENSASPVSLRAPDPPLSELRTKRTIRGFTHGFYRYPAATSPELVREILLRLTRPGDHVMDPFMGGGTTIVEAIAHGRWSWGFDVNPLAVSVTRAKTTPLTKTDWDTVEVWADEFPFHYPTQARVDSRTRGMPGRLTWLFASASASINVLWNHRQRTIARCALLRVGQWALESRDEIPATDVLDARLKLIVHAMRLGMAALVGQAFEHGVDASQIKNARRLVLGSTDKPALISTSGIPERSIRLVVTSPPYPGIHVLYHRWQVEGRRETAAPYWIARRRDGAGASFYTMGGRSLIGEERYFSRLRGVYTALKPYLRSDALVVQLVAFKEPPRQLGRFLDAMDAA